MRTNAEQEQPIRSETICKAWNKKMNKGHRVKERSDNELNE